MSTRRHAALRALRRPLNFSLARLSSAAAICAALAGLAPSAPAAADHWTGGTDALWDTAGNWDLGLPTAASDAIFPAVIPATGGTVTLGTGDTALSLTFRNNYTLTGGDLTLGLGGNITVTPGATAVIQSTLIGTNGLTLTAGNGLAGADVEAGGGTLTLSGTNLYSGATTINAGTLNISATGNLGDGSATNTLTLNGGTLRATASLLLGTNRTIAVGAGGGTLSTAAGTTLTADGALSGSGPLTVTGEGVTVLSADNSGFTGDVAVISGTANSTLRLANNNALTSGTVTVTNNATVGAVGTAVDLAGVTIGSGVSLILNANTTPGNRTALTTSSGDNVWNGNITVAGDGLTQLYANTGTTLTINGDITGAPGYLGTIFLRGANLGFLNGDVDAVGGVLSKTDTGTWTINSNSINVAQIRVADGTMKIGHENTLPTAMPIILGQASATSGTLDLNNFNQEVAGLTSDATSTSTNHRILNSGAGTPTFTVNSFTFDTFSGHFDGPMNLVKTGPGSLLVRGGTASTMVGAISVTGGTLDFQADNKLGDANNDILLDGGRIDYTSTTTDWTPAATRVITIGTNGGTIGGSRTIRVATAGQLTGSGLLTREGLGVASLDLQQANVGFTGDVIINGGVIELKSSQSLGTNTLGAGPGGSQTVTVNGGILSVRGDVATTSAYNVHLVGGGLGFQSGNLGVQSGPLTVDFDSFIYVRDFFATNTGRTGTLSGSVTGSGNLNVTGPTAGGGTLILNADLSGYTGSFIASPFATVQVLKTSPTAGFLGNAGTTQIRAANFASPVMGVAGVNATYYNFGNNPTASNNPIDYVTLLMTEQPRAVSRSGVDLTINIPNNGGGTFPIIPVQGFSTNTNDGVMWKGLLNITAEGQYQFASAVDDQDVLFIDGVQVGAHAANTGGATTNLNPALITLSAGPHSIVYKMSQGTGGGYSVLQYSGPDTNGSLAVVGSVAGSLTTGSLAATVIGTIGSVGGTSTFDTGVDVAAAGFTGAGGTTLNLTSGTLSNITITGTSQLAGGGAVTINPNTASIVFNDAIGDSGAGVGVTFNGAFQATYKGTNTYTGTTTVNNGRLVLDAAGGNAIAGNLTVNAANVLGRVRNVVVNRSNQIADTATVTITNGILDLGANNDTIDTLNMNGATAELLGTGTLMATTLNLQQGFVSAALASASGVLKNTAGTMTLAGANTYTGVTTISNGVLNVRNATGLGATGAGNDTQVLSGAQLQFQQGALGSEAVTINGSGADGTGSLRSIAGNNGIGSLTLGSDSTVQVDSGRLLVAAPMSGSGTLAARGGGTLGIAGNVPAGLNVIKNGSGTLMFTSPSLGAFPTVTHNAGALGFTGTQSFGTITVPAGLAYQFTGDPGAGTTINVPAGTSLLNDGAASNGLLSRVGTGTGAFVLTQDSGGALDFTGKGVGLGALGMVTFSGSITPGAAGYAFAGPGSGLGTGIAPNRLSLTNPLTGTNALTVTNGTVNLTNLTNTQTGTITVGAGGRIQVLNNTNLGDASNDLVLDGGTLEISNISGSAGQIFAHFGNPVAGGSRTLTIGANGGTIDVPSYTTGNNGFMLLGNASTNLAGNPLLGTGRLTKTGLGFLFIDNATDFAGNIVLAGNGGELDFRGNGSWVPATATTVTVGQSAILNLDNTNALGSGRQIPGVYNGDRLGANVTIALQGGRFAFTPRGAAGQSAETVGTLTLGLGTNELSFASNPANSVGSDLTITNLTHELGGVLRIIGAPGTLGAAGANNTRLTVTQINGVATANGPLPGWATFNSTNYLSYGATGVVQDSGTNQGAAAFSPVAATVFNLNATGTATLNDEADDIAELYNLRFGFNGAQTLAFTDAADTLYIGGGGILSDGSNQTRAVGASVNSGKITAGLVGAAGLQELFLNNNSNTMTINANIVDNSASAPVAVVKSFDGQVTLAAANSYTGGTIVNRGTLQANVAGSLGSGSVLVKNSRLTLQVPGTSTGTTPITVMDNGELFLNNNTAAFNTPGDRFIINSNAVIIGPNAGNAGQGLNSLTRVSGTPANGGEIQLLAGAIVGHQFSAVGEIGAGINTIKNLGTNADLFFGLSANLTEPRSTITIGAGTPWKGLSTDRTARSLEEGTILANSDFWLQGQLRDGAYVALTLGAVNNAGAYSIVNQSGGPINAYVSGLVQLAEDQAVSLPSDLTFVVTSAGELRPNNSASLGSNADPALNAKVRVLAGGTLNPGNFVGVGTAVNQPPGMPYPLMSPLNGKVTVEAGGRMLLDDPSGVGSTAAGLWTIQRDGILELGNSGNVFLGANNGLINDGQFVFEPGAIVRFSQDQRWYKLDEFVNNEPNGQRLVYQIFNGDRNLTEAVNPFLVAAVGTPTVVAQDLTIGNGGMLTNDNSDRTVRQRRGTINLTDGAILAGTTQTYFNIQEDLAVAAGATIQIGTDRWIEGQPKTGAVQLNGSATNIAGAGATFNVNDGAQLAFGNVHVFPDAANINLAAPITALPSVGGSSPQPGNGSTLLLNSANYIEIIGQLTGSGSVLANGDHEALGVGWGATTDFTFDGTFEGWTTGGPNRAPSLIKVGDMKMTLTNTSNTPNGTANSEGSLSVYQGELVLAGPNGRWNGGEMRLSRGGILTFDNSGTAITDRQTIGTGNRWLTAAGGGEFRLIGNATQIADVAMFGLADSAGTGTFGLSGSNSGGFGKVTVLPAAGTTSLTTSLTFASMERFDNSGERKSTWLIRGTGVGGLPGTYDSAGNYTPNAANPVDGLVFITAPNFISANTLGNNGGTSGFIFGGPGTPVAAVRGDLLASSNPNAIDGDFATIDITSGASRTGVRALQASEYAATSISNSTLSLNVRATGAQSYTGETRFQVLKLENGASVNVSGTQENLTQVSQLQLTAGGILVPAGSAASLVAAGHAVIRSQTNVSAYVHAFGDLNVAGNFFSDIGLVKDGGGTATFAAGSLDGLRGRLTVHEGTLNINDSISNVRGTGVNTIAFTGVNVALNGGTLNLNGKSQFFNSFESGNFLVGDDTEGGTLTSAAAATVTVQGGGVFSGHITGAITLDKVSNNTLLLTNSNSTTGNLVVRQGSLILRDDASFKNIGTLDLNYARLDIDNGYLSTVDNRINSSAVVNLRGADIVHRGRAGEVTTQNFGTVNVLEGHNLIQTLAGGGGASVTSFNLLNRSAGATMSFQQNYGFIGTAGNDTTAIRYLINNLTVNGDATTTPADLIAANNGILGGWAIVNNDSFATYDPVRGIGSLGNTEDGFANYGSGDLSAATATQNVNDATGRTIATSKTVNAIRNAPTATQTNTLNAGVVLTINTGGLLTNGNVGINYNGGAITSNSGELNVFVQQSTTTINSVITGNIALTKAGQGTLTLTGANNYTGITYVGQGSTGTSSISGALNLNTAGANGVDIVSIPGDLHIGSTTVTVGVANAIAQTSNVTLSGGGVLNMRDAAATTETLRSLTFLDAGSDSNNRGSVARANAQATSTLNLTAPVPITATNTNPTTTPTLSVNLGNVAFTGPAGIAQTLMINSPVTANGLAAAGLLINASIGAVPTGVAEGGLVKAGNGLLILGGSSTTQFGNPSTPTEVFNIQSGYVRVDNVNALGTANAITTVQNGATLLLNSGTGITGSVRLKDGSRIGATITGSLLGAVGSTAFLDIPSGANVQFDAFDSLVPTTNAGNITVNDILTGAGTINQVGMEFAAGINGGGFLELRNTGNTFSGNIHVGTNAILRSNPNVAALTGSTLGTATISLDGGAFQVRDNGDGTTTAQTIVYGNNVNLTANSLIDFDRVSGTAVNKTISFGTLNVAAGTQVLNTIYGTNSPITANGYRASFAMVDGPGALVKGGTRFVDIQDYAATFSGNIEVAGPQGFSLPTSGNLTLNAATSNLNNFTVRGFHSFVAGKTVNVSGMLDVQNNAGEVANGLGGVSTGGIVGAVTLTNNATVTTNILRNNGVVGANNSASTLTATSIRGTGMYQAYGQNLTLNGSLADDGATPTVLRVAGTGTSAVILNAGNGTSTGGVDVQSGILRVTPSGTVTNPLGTGAIRVQGQVASTLGTNSQPIAAVNATLEFAGTDITQSGDITSSGTVRVSSGTTTLSGVIHGTPAVSSNLADFQAATVPGLLEGRYTTTTGLPDTNANGRVLTSARQPNPGNFGVRMEPRMGQMNVVTQNGLTGWSDNTDWIYTGYFYDADGVFTFMENVDDSTLVSIDGVDRLLSNSGTNPYQTVTSTATTKGQRLNTLDTANVNTGTPQGLAAIPNNPNLPAGWHTIEIRFDNGAGGAGPSIANGFGANYGFGLNPDGTMALDGSQASRPIDPGNGTLFRTAASGKGNVQVDAGATLSVAGFSQVGTVTFNGGSSTSAGLLNVTGANSQADNIVLNGTLAPQGVLDIADNVTVMTGGLSVAPAGTLTMDPVGHGTLLVTGPNNLNAGAGAAVDILGGTLNIASTSVGTGGGAVRVNTGATLIVDGSLSGAVDVGIGATLKGGGTIAGDTTTGVGSVLSPGNGVGVLTFANAELQMGIDTQYVFQANATSSDGIAFAGPLSGLTIFDTWTLTLVNAGLTDPTGMVFTLFDGDSGAFALNGGFIGNPTIDYGNSGWGGGTIIYDAPNNDILLIDVVPEPGSAALLLGGMACLSGVRMRRRKV